MKKKSIRTLTPKLRFPEFRDRPVHSLRLGDVAEDATERNRKTLDANVVMGVFKGEGMLPMEKRLVAKDVSRYKVVEKDWFAYNPMRLNIGSIARWHGDGHVLVSPDYVVFRCSNDSDQKLDANYLDQFRYSDQWDRFVTLSGDGSVRVRIYFRDLATLRLILPSLSEQQKIAECLSSLDGLFAAEGRTLEAIKAHKKGLMQQLFPQPGETQPRLRFPEFRDKGEWEENPLSVIAENLDNKRVPITESNRIKGDVPYYGASGIVDYVRDYLFDEDLLCVSEDGANLVARTYPIAFPISGKTWVNNHAHVLRFDKPATQKMVEDYLNSTDLRDFITGMAQPKLNRTMLDTIPIPLPEQEEQQRIAACLITLDIRIAAEAAKIDSLKTHKRGLMQQLFPAPE